MSRIPILDQRIELNYAYKCLMAPLYGNESDAFAFAFGHCRNAFKDFDTSIIDSEYVLADIDALARIMNGPEPEVPQGEKPTRKKKPFASKVRQLEIDQYRARDLTFDEKEEFSRTINSLFDWFNKKNWEREQHLEPTMSN